MKRDGFLIKRAVKSGSNWRERYFILSDNALTYYIDQKGAKKGAAKGTIIFSKDSTVSARDVEAIAFCFSVITADKTLYVAAQSEADMNEWIMAIQAKIDNLAKTKRGYLNKRAVISGANWKRRYFMMGSDHIAYYVSESTTKQVKGIIHFKRSTTIESPAQPDGEKTPGFCFGVVTTKKTIYLAAETDEEMCQWIDALKGNIQSLPEDDNEEAEADLNGVLEKRAVVKGNNWRARWFVLRGSSLTYYKDESATQCKGEFTLTPDCSVYETNLKPFAFELVTPRKVLHAFAKDNAERQLWIKTIKKNISESTTQQLMDPIQAAARKRAAHDDFYDVTFESKKPLGVTMEQHGEWAVVKVASDRSSGIEIGSVLTAVNGESVILTPYAEAIRLIKGWEPPLVLRFRRAPVKKGVLTKQSRGESSKLSASNPNWKHRHFILRNGTLEYYTSAQGDRKGEFPLVASAVSLVPKSDIKKDFCFRLVSGSGNLVLQGMTKEDMLSWASALYHAITIANGGGYILEQERRRVEKKEGEIRLAANLLKLREMAAKREATKLEAERHAEEKKGVEATAKARAAAEAEAAAKAKLEAAQAAKRAQELAAKAEKEERERAEVEARAAEEAARRAEEEAARAKLEAEEAERKRIEDEAVAAAAAAEAARNAEAEEEAAASAAEAAAREQEETESAAREEEEARLREEGEAAEVERIAKDALAAQLEMDAAARAAGLDPDSEDESLEATESAVTPVVTPTSAPAPQPEVHQEEQKTQMILQKMHFEIAAASGEVDSDSSDEDEEDEDSIRNVTSGASTKSKAKPRMSLFGSKMELDFNEDDDSDDEDTSTLNLTRAEMEEAFRSMDVAQKGWLNPMTFGAAHRAITGKHNMMLEMQLFQKYNPSGSGHITLDEFCAVLAAEQDTTLLKGLHAYASGSLANF